MSFYDFITNEIFLWVVLCLFSYFYGSVNNAVIISVLAKKKIFVSKVVEIQDQ